MIIIISEFTLLGLPVNTGCKCLSFELFARICMSYAPNAITKICSPVTFSIPFIWKLHIGSIISCNPMEFGQGHFCGHTAWGKLCNSGSFESALAGF